MKTKRNRQSTWLLLALAFLGGLCGEALAWWDKSYTIRQEVTIDTSAQGIDVSDPIGPAVVLVRLHEGNFQFLAAREDGSDIRFVAGDDKTPLAFHLEKYDSLLNEGFAWVSVPQIEPGAQTKLYLYYGAETPGEGGHDPAKTYPEQTLLVYHFAERNAPAKDSTGRGPSAENAGVLVEGSLIGPGVRLTASEGLRVPSGEALSWAGGAGVTGMVWVRPTAIDGRRVVLAYEGFRLGIEEGKPFVEAGGQQATAAEAITANNWHHLAFVGEGAQTILYVNGVNAGTVAAGIPALSGALVIGAASAQGGEGGFVGEVDELMLEKTSRGAGYVKFAAQSQGTGANAAKAVVLGEVQAGKGGHNETLEHMMLFGDIARNMMFDGWIAVGVCVLMMIFGWTVAVRKFNYLNSIHKGSDAFLKLWKDVSSDLTVLESDDPESFKTMGGRVDEKTSRLIHRSPLYHVYHIGAEEIRHRLGSGRERSNAGLSARSIQAIRAALEAGLVRENQRMNSGLIFLTIGIAGGPYVGLLGTVVGVMITFALIAKTGEVEVNSIAPGIASALLATVFGLIVAIPALFIYSYLSSRIKDLLASMQVFIDEFIAKMAEFYPPPSEASPLTSRDNGSASRVSEVQTKPSETPCKLTPERATTTST